MPSIFVKPLYHGAKTVSIDAECCEYIYSIQAKIQAKLEIAPQVQVLVYNGKALKSGLTLRHYAIPTGSTLDLFIISDPRASKTIIIESRKSRGSLCRNKSVITVKEEAVALTVDYYDILPSQVRFWETAEFPYSFELEKHQHSTEGTLHAVWVKIEIKITSLVDQTCHRLLFEPTDTISKLKFKIRDMKRIPPDQQLVTFEGFILQNNYNFIYYNIVTGSKLHFDHRVQIEVKILSGNSIMIHAKASDTIKTIKSSIRKKEKLPKHFELYFAGNILPQDNATTSILNSSKLVLQLSRYAITFTTAVRECCKCRSILVPGDGIILSNCSHTFCRSCLSKIAITSESCCLCAQKISRHEMSSILPDEELFNKDLPYRIYCSTTNCFGSCFYRDQGDFNCYSCGHTNCVSCVAQHEGMNCKEYQENLTIDTIQYLKTLVKEGKATHCPKCDVIIKIKFECNWIKCCTCEMEIYVQHQGENSSRLATSYDKIFQLAVTYNHEMKDMRHLINADCRNLAALNEDLTMKLAQRMKDLQNSKQSFDCLALELKEKDDEVKKVKQTTQEEKQDLQKQIDELNQQQEDAHQQNMELIEQIGNLKQQNMKYLHDIEERNDFIRDTIKDMEQKFEIEQEELQRRNHELELRLRSDTGHNHEAGRDSLSWKVNQKDVTLLKKELGRGAWGVVFLGEFRGQKVAVKKMHEIIAPDHIEVLQREISIMAGLRHPNLLQFIGAVIENNVHMVITEVMDASLRQTYEKKEINPEPSCRPVILSIMRDVAVGLNYLHCLREPIIHRDLSSANVLLESKGPGKWKTKISDFGSANLARLATTNAPGAQVYSAPESLQDITRLDTTRQTTKMDVFSYGILMCEILTCKFPGGGKVSFAEILTEVRAIGGSGLTSFFNMSPPICSLAEWCIRNEPYKRPMMIQVIKELDFIIEKKKY